MKYLKENQDLRWGKILLVLFYILMTFSLSRYIFEPFDMYNEYIWLDIVMHITGGILFANLYTLLAKEKYLNIKNTIYFVLFIGVAWEIFELYYNLVLGHGPFSGVLDTVKDLFDDMLGAAVAFYIYKNTIEH